MSKKKKSTRATANNIINKKESAIERVIKNFNLKDFVLSVIPVIIFATLAITSIAGKSATSDESSHLIRGRIFLETLDYRLNQHNPVGYNAVQAIPTFLEKDVKMEEREHNYYWEIADKNKLKDNWVIVNGGTNEFANKVLFLPRIWMVVLNGLGLYFYFQTIKKNWNIKIAFISSMFFALSSTFIAHARLITTDVPVMWAIFFTTYALHKFIKAPQDQKKKAYWIFMLISILAMQVKFTATIVCGACTLILFIKEYLDNKQTKSAKHDTLLLKISKFIKRVGKSLIVPIKTIGIWALALFVIYGFQFGTLKDMTYGADWRYDGNTEKLVDIAGKIDKYTPGINDKELLLWAYDNIPLPFPQYINGFFENVFIHNFFWYGKCLLGKCYGAGETIYYYFPLAYSVKEPAPIVISTVVGIGLFVYFFIKDKRKLLATTKKYGAMVIVTLFLIFLLVNTSINLGVRHMLPLYPFLFLILGWSFSRLFDKNKYLTIGILGLGALYSLVSLIIHNPDYISYYNEFAGGSENGFKVVSGTNFNWNQDDGFAETYMEETGAVDTYEDLPDDGKALLIVKITDIYHPYAGGNNKKLRELYESGKVKRVEIIHDTHWVFEVEKNMFDFEEETKSLEENTGE
ncbi:glycosyltransferase family 39 protein [Candidatus Dojkabacteria bacterium]|nr:glycosyltransferase family 39 protein [Candidatus Dojkabacteria bacterium]